MTLKERLDPHDREIAAIRKLILTGMKMLNRNQEQITALVAEGKRTDQRLRSLEASVQQFVDGLRRGGNGHTKRPLR
jgi:hypothetical protein